MVLPLLRLHDVRGELEALRRDSDAGPEAWGHDPLFKSFYLISKGLIFVDTLLIILLKTVFLQLSSVIKD